LSWIRLDDDYIYHPKFVALSANAFRLWHEGMAYCRKLLTDGLIPRAALKTFRYAKRAHVDELMTPVGDGLAPLWEPVADFGFKVHDYLIWNRSREQELKDRESSKTRAKESRDKRTCAAREPHGAQPVQNRNKEEGSVVLSSSEKERERKPFVTTASRWPIYKGNRLVVFDWQLTKMQATLGPFAELVEWDIWLDQADQRAMREPTVAADWWPWLQAELLVHAREQGWSVAVDGATVGKQTSKLMAAVAAIQREAQS
jgi:hypothetical protein